MGIITVTPNTAIDEVLQVVQVQTVKATFNTVRRLLFPSGKGVNVARVIATLRRSVKVLGFVGTDGLQRFEQDLSSKYIHLSLTPVLGETRVNTTLCDNSKHAVWHIRRPGYSVNHDRYTYFEKRATRSVVKGDVVVFAGTLPPGIEGHKFASLISFCRRKGSIAIVDSSGKDLESAVRARPFMMKPNVEELTSLLGLSRTPTSTAELLDAANRLLLRGIELVVISRGERGVLVRNLKEAWAANVKLDRPTSMTEAIGSGDALVAGFAVGFMERRSLADTTRLAVACGAANVLSIGPGVLKEKDVNRLYKSVVIRKLV